MNTDRDQGVPTADEDVEMAQIPVALSIGSDADALTSDRLHRQDDKYSDYIENATDTTGLLHDGQTLIRRPSIVEDQHEQDNARDVQPSLTNEREAVLTDLMIKLAREKVEIMMAGLMEVMIEKLRSGQREGSRLDVEANAGNHDGTT
jgi:hypothetical protein